MSVGDLFYIQYNQTPLHLAAWGGHIDVATTLIQHGAEIDARSSVSRFLSIVDIDV